jgi:hypothetical protein
LIEVVAYAPYPLCVAVITELPSDLTINVVSYGSTTLVFELAYVNPPDTSIEYTSAKLGTWFTTESFDPLALKPMYAPKMPKLTVPVRVCPN